MDPKRILITRTDRLGDVVLSTPVIRVLRKAYPDAYIAFMVRPENRDVVLNNPDLDEVISYDKYGRHKSVIATCMFAMSLRKKKFDTSIALHPTNRVHVIMFLAGIPCRVGYDRKIPFLLTKAVSHVKHKGEKHESQYNLDLLKAAGFKVGEDTGLPYMFTSEKDKHRINDLFISRGIKGDVLCLHAGASCLSKRWDAARFSEVADTLHEKFGLVNILTGGEETVSISREVVSLSRSAPVDLTGALSVGELAELISRSKLFISNDSGPVHISVAVGTPVISIFGRKDPGLSPKRWGPLGNHDIALHKDAGCDECRAHECVKGFKCLKAISVRDVTDAADNILTANK